jgi:class 3 adenylate cyclase
MFVDLVGSTALATRLDPEEMRDLLRQFQNTTAGEVLRFEGHVAKLMGDGALAYFGWPQAHEDEAERAVRAALAVVSAVNSLSVKGGQQLSVRVGIATGVVVVGDLIGVGSAQENAVLGETPNLAARLQTMAEPGMVVISELTHRLVGNLFEVIAIRPQKLAGFDTPVSAFKVIGEGRSESRFEALHANESAPLAGREHDIALLLDRWRLAASGEGQVVELFGEAGIGKSRILQELREHLKDEAHTRLRYYCSPYHVETALYPVTDQLLRAGDTRRTDSPDRQLDCLEQLLADSTKDPNEAKAMDLGGRASTLGTEVRRRLSGIRTFWILRPSGRGRSRSRGTGARRFGLYGDGAFYVSIRVEPCHPLPVSNVRFHH